MIHSRVGCLVALTFGILSCTGAAFGQSVGPDVIVGDLPGISNNAVSGLYDSFAVGTTSCNKGNATLNWHTGGTDNRHPAISQNLFRLRDGRFEQIGQGWLKHGFTALQGTVCGTCTANPDGTALGVGCSDPYSSGLNNGGANAMGPKWQVNAATGLFPYPFAASVNSAAIRVRPADVGLSGDRYFVEGQYICGDDAGSGNKNNNASYRELTETGTTDFTFNTSGSTVREQPAIYAWQAVDPTVTITTFDVPGDGRFILACKVTGPVSGAYTYEYALHNLNSHRCAGSFIVPLPGSQGALSAVGFHDAEYVGEPNALTDPANPASDDWSVSGTAAGSTSVAWAGPAYSGTPPVYTVSPTTPFLVTAYTAGTGNDHTANVIRWGNLFNFRFTCATAPATGTVAVGLWRPGTGSSFLMSAPTPGGATNGTLTASCCMGTVCSVTSQAACTGTWGLAGTTCSPDPCVSGSCCVASTGGCSATTLNGCTVGTWTANAVCSPNPCPQPPTGSCCVPNIGTCSVSTQLACAAGSTWAQGGSCSPNICAVASGGCCVSSVCSVTTQPNCNGTFLGNNTTCTSAVCPSGNDACAAAIPLCDGAGVVSTTVGATFSATDFNLGASTCGSSGTSADVWYSYVPATSVSISIDTCTASFDTVLSASTGTCGSLVAVACNDDAGTAAPPTGCGANNNLHSRVTFTATAGVRYLIRVAGYQGATGTFTVTATGGGGTGCSSNGSCCTGTTCTVTASTACSGTFTAGGVCSPNPCDPVGACCISTACTSTTRSGCTGVFTVAGVCSPNPCNPTGTCCTGTTCTLTLQSGCTGSFTAGASCGTNTCNPSGACCSAGNCTAVLQLSCTTGTFTIGGTCTPSPCPPLSDDCANRQGIPTGTTPFDTTNATTDGPPDALCAGSGDSQIGKDVWYNFPCTFDGTLDIDTCGSSFDTKLAVYDGYGCANFDTRIMACNDDATCGTTATVQSKLTINVLCGHHYTIRVGGYTNGSGVIASGAGVLNLTGHPAALGSCCATDGSCTQTQQSCCVGAWTTGGVCSPNPCPQPSGACCNSGVCSIQTHIVCGGANYQGDNTVCTPNPCPQISGACCVGTTCSIANSTACSGTFQGAGSVCGTPANPTTCCRANYNQVNGINVADIFDFLAGFFAADPRADYNGDGVINVQDVFDFLAGWFVGC